MPTLHCTRRTSPLRTLVVALAIALAAPCALSTSSAHAQTAPVVKILGPADHAIVQAGSFFNLFGTAEDAADGLNLSYRLSWSSSRDGALGEGYYVPGNSLSVGTHVITASATGGAGLTGSASITLDVVASGNTSPSIYLNGPYYGGTANGASFVQGETVNLYASFSDAQDGFNTRAPTWSSNRDGTLDTGIFIQRSTLSVGTHTITASATDSGGLTGSATLKVIIAPALPAPTIDSLRFVNDTIPLGERWEGSFTTTHARTVTIQIDFDGFGAGFPFPQDTVDGLISINSIAEGATFIVTATNATGSATRSVRVSAIRPPIAGPPVTQIGPASVWLGLKNSDDVGTKFDLKAEVYKNGVLVTSGQINDVAGGSSGFNNAKLRTIALASIAPYSYNPSDVLSFKLYVRIAASSGHRSGTARLWYNDSQADSGLSMVIGGATSSHYLRASALLVPTPGPGPKKTIDVLVDRAANGNAFKLIGSWSTAP